MRVKEIKKKAKGCLKGKWAKTSVFLYLFNLLVSLGMIGYYVLYVASEIMKDEKLLFIAFPFLIPAFIIQAILQVGVFKTILNIAKGKDYKFSDLFSGARYWLKVLGIIFLTTLFTILWTFLFVIPGIIKAFSYSMSLYVLADNPEKGVLECIRESRKIMKGNKWKYFWMNFTIGLWAVLYMAVMYGTLFGLAFAIRGITHSVASGMLIILALAMLFLIGFVILTYVLTSYLYVAQGVMYLDISKKDDVDGNAEVTDTIENNSVEETVEETVEEVETETVEEIAEEVETETVGETTEETETESMEDIAEEQETENVEETASEEVDNSVE